MTIPISSQLLPRPPRVKEGGIGYDPKELDRWFLRIHALIGVPPPTKNPLNKPFNIPSAIGGITTGGASLDDRVSELEDTTLHTYSDDVVSTQEHEELSLWPILSKAQDSTSKENQDILTLYWAGV